MPPRKTMPKRRRVAKKGGRRAPRRMGASGVPDIASLTESYTGTQTSGTAGSFALSFNNLTLAQGTFKRAIAVAAQYQFFRIKKVSYTYKPTFDTFAPGGPNTLPYLYWSINKTGEAQLLNQQMLTQRGAIPIRLDDRNYTISYKPMVGTQAVATTNLANNPGSYLTSPWLNTDNLANTNLWSPSTVQHFGHYALITSAGVYQIDLHVSVEFEFKKPRVQPVSSNDPVEEFFKVEDQVVEPEPL